MGEEGARVDPADPDAFGRELHGLLDACLARLRSARETPWRPPPADLGARVALDAPSAGRPAAEVFETLARDVMPHATGNAHPRFFGWVHGNAAPVALGAELVAATMNSNCGGRDHGATRVEVAVIEWARRLAGLPGGAFGVLTTGTSAATLLALATARRARFGAEVLERGVRACPPVAVYVGVGAHSCVAKALRVLGHGDASLRRVAEGADGRMDADALDAAIGVDVAAGTAPLAVVGTAGSVNLGAYDDLAGLADVCARRGVWFHVDAAFGFGALLGDARLRALVAGIGRADSICADFHKWLAVPYDCGICLVADGSLQRETFASRPAYLESQGEGLAGGEPWFCDYGIELSRGFRALKVWTVLSGVGTDALGAAIVDNCRQAALMGELVDASPVLRLARPVISNVCCFEPLGTSAEDVAARLQVTGDAVFSTTRVDGVSCLRAAIVNHRTTEADVRAAVGAVERAVGTGLERPDGAG